MEFLIFGILLVVPMLAANYGSVNISGVVRKIGGASMIVYKNIPYARPPVGDLRFELPKEVISFQETGNTSPIYCPQYSSPYTSLKKSMFGQEDCLFLDIYATKTEKLMGLPVLIYFHGGRFSYGSKEEYSGDFLLRHNDMIVVIPNYRLGLLGFPPMGGSANLGLWDQRAAMAWVRRNIASFGGDSSRVTIAGHDAGAAAVGLHVLSPKSHEYFTAVLSVSGTALDPWVIGRSPTSAAFAKKTVGCPSLLKDQLKACLKNQTLQTILHDQAEIGNEMFRPIIDKEAKTPFLAKAPQALYVEEVQKDANYLFGISDEEALVEVKKEFLAAVRTKHLDKIIAHLLKPYFSRGRNMSHAVQAVKYHYLRGVQVPTFEAVFPQVTSMLSDYLYNIPLHTALKLHGKKTSGTYMYVFNDHRKNDINYETIFDSSKKHLGTGHLADVPHLFDTNLRNGVIYSNQKTELLCRIWGEFINKHSLTSHDWKKYSNDDTNYMEISDTASPKSGYKSRALDFWTILFPELQRMDFSAPVTPQPLQEPPSPVAWGAAGLAVLLGVLCIALVGVVVVTSKKMTQTSVTIPKDQVKYNNIERRFSCII